MPTLQEIQKIYNEFVCSAIETEYNTWNTNPDDLQPLVDKLKEALEEYVEESKDERNIP